LQPHNVMTSLVHDLLGAYWVFLPWLILAIGMVILLVGSTTGRSPNRLMMIGLTMTGAALVWFIARLAA
jgi:multimeric flavodoxin WrbA